MWWSDQILLIFSAMYKLNIFLTTTITVEANTKGQKVYKEFWTPKQNEYLNVQYEPENVVDK